MVASEVSDEEHKALINNLDSRSREHKKEGTDGESWLLNCMFVCSTKIKRRVVRLDAQTGCGEAKEISRAKQTTLNQPQDSKTNDLVICDLLFPASIYPP